MRHVPVVAGRSAGALWLRVCCGFSVQDLLTCRGSRVLELLAFFGEIGLVRKC